MRVKHIFKTGPWALLPLAFLLFGCDAETPTAPAQQVVPPVSTPQASSVWNITVTADPNEFSIQDGNSVVSNVLVVARRSDNGQLVANGTTALLRTSLGTLTTDSGSGSSVQITFDERGTARAVLNATATVATTVVVRAQIEQSFGSVNISLLDIPPEPFRISGISPVSGPPTGGTQLTITGGGFEDPVRVTFNVLGQTLLLTNVRVVSASQITARTPAIDLPVGQNALASLTLENAFDATGSPGGTDTISSAFTYTRGGGGGNPTTMKIFSLSPTSGPNEGGTRVTILGEGFGSQVQVYFTNGPLIESQIVSLTSTRIEVITPSATGPNAPNANQRVSLRLVDPVTGATVTQANAFQYGADSSGLFVSSIAPNQDTYLGGSLVTIFGQGFEEPVAVGLAGFGQSIISVTGTQIVVRTSSVNMTCASVTGATTVTNIETNEQISNGPTFTYLPITPRLIDLDPSIGNQNGTNSVIVRGATGTGIGFRPPPLVRVLINGSLASVTGSSAEVNRTVATVTVTVPPFTGTFPTVPCTVTTPAGTETGTQNANISVPVRVINLETGCEDTLAAAYTYMPRDTECRVAATN